MLLDAQVHDVLVQKNWAKFLSEKIPSQTGILNPKLSYLELYIIISRLVSYGILVLCKIGP